MNKHACTNRVAGLTHRLNRIVYMLQVSAPRWTCFRLLKKALPARASASVHRP